MQPPGSSPPPKRSSGWPTSPFATGPNDTHRLGDTPAERPAPSYRERMFAEREASPPGAAAPSDPLAAPAAPKKLGLGEVLENAGAIGALLGGFVHGVLRPTDDGLSGLQLKLQNLLGHQLSSRSGLVNGLKKILDEVADRRSSDARLRAQLHVVAKSLVPPGTWLPRDAEELLEVIAANAIPLPPVPDPGPGPREAEVESVEDRPRRPRSSGAKRASTKLARRASVSPAQAPTSKSPKSEKKVSK